MVEMRGVETRGEPYEMLKDQLVSSADWPIISSIEGLTATDRIPVMERHFMSAASYHDDKAAERLLKLLVAAIREGELSPFLKRRYGDTGPWVAPYSDECKKVEARAHTKVAQKMIELLALLPFSRKHDICVHDTESDHHWEKEDGPTLLKTKGALLLLVAEQWASTRDEEEADKLFEFLTTCSFRFREESALISSVVREVTKHSFLPDRLRRYLAQVADRDGYRGTAEGVSQILALAWVRNNSDEQIRNILHATEPLMGCSARAYALANRVAKRIKKLDVLAATIPSALKLEGRYEDLAGRGCCPIYGEVTWEFPDLLDDIRVQLKVKGFGQQQEADFEKMWSNASAILSAWAYVNFDPLLHIHLHLELEMPHSKAIAFQRSASIR